MRCQVGGLGIGYETGMGGVRECPETAPAPEGGARRTTQLSLLARSFRVVPEEGFEPSHPFGFGILSPAARLPDWRAPTDVPRGTRADRRVRIGYECRPEAAAPGRPGRLAGDREGAAPTIPSALRSPVLEGKHPPPGSRRGRVWNTAGRRRTRGVQLRNWVAAPAAARAAPRSASSPRRTGRRTPTPRWPCWRAR